MSCTVYASMIVGFKFDEVAKIVKKKNEKYVTKFDEDTGDPYQKDVSESTCSLEIFGESIEISDDRFSKVQEAIGTYFKGSNVKSTWGDYENPSTILIGIDLAESGDIMYGGGDHTVSLDEVTKAISELREYGKEPKMYLSTSISC